MSSIAEQRACFLREVQEAGGLLVPPGLFSSHKSDIKEEEILSLYFPESPCLLKNPYKVRQNLVELLMS